MFYYLLPVQNVLLENVIKLGESIFFPADANEEDISKEIMEIHDAIANGIASYTLKYSAKTKKSLLSIKIDTK